MANETKAETFGQKIRKLQASVKPLFAAGQTEDETEKEAAEKQVLALRSQILGAKKLLQDLEHEFDAVVDLRDTGAFGDGFMPKVSRIRKKREAGEKTEKTDELAALDF